MPHPFITDVCLELHRANRKHAKLNSYHEAYAVILEELDEFWDVVRLKPKARCPRHARKELVKIAAMAMRSATDIGLGERQPCTCGECLGRPT